jgi:hypothetical protein
MRHLKLAGCVLTGAIALTALAPAGGVAAAGAAPPTTVPVKAFSLAAVKKLDNDAFNAVGDEGAIAGEIFKKDTTKRHGVRVYPTHKALRSDVLRLSKKLKGRVKLGAVPSVAKGKAGDFYIGESTAKRFKVVAFFHVAGNNFWTSVSIGSGHKSLKDGFSDNVWMIAEAAFEGNENAVANKLSAHVHNSSPSHRSYPTGASLAKYVKTMALWYQQGPVSASAPPTAAKAKDRELYLGATTNSRFSETAYTAYKTKGWKLDITCTRSLSGPAKFTVTAIKVH